MWFFIIIGIIVIIIIKNLSRKNNYYQVIDKNNEVRTTGRYNQCKEWLKATKQMENLAGVYNNYKIKKMNF